MLFTQNLAVVPLVPVSNVSVFAFFMCFLLFRFLQHGLQINNYTQLYIDNDRKKEAPSGSLQSLHYVPPKKPKLATHVGSHQRPPFSSAEAWEVVALDIDTADFVPMALEANDNDEGDKVIGIICGAIKMLKNQKWKPDTLVYMGLLYLAKIRPSIFSNDCILHALSSLLKRDQSYNFKSKGNPLVPVLAANLLMKGFHDKKNWPEIFVKVNVIKLQFFVSFVTQSRRFSLYYFYSCTLTMLSASAYGSITRSARALSTIY